MIQIDYEPFDVPWVSGILNQGPGEVYGYERSIAHRALWSYLEPEPSFDEVQDYLRGAALMYRAAWYRSNGTTTVHRPTRADDRPVRHPVITRIGPARVGLEVRRDEGVPPGIQDEETVREYITDRVRVFGFLTPRHRMDAVTWRGLQVVQSDSGFEVAARARVFGYCPVDAHRGPRGGVWVRQPQGQYFPVTSREPQVLLKHPARPTLDEPGDLAAGDGAGGAVVLRQTRDFTCGARLVRVTTPKNGAGIVTKTDVDLLAPGTFHRVTDFEVSPDGRLLALAVRYKKDRGDSGIELFRKAGEAWEKTTGFDVPAMYLSFSPDGLTLAALGAQRAAYKPHLLTILDMEE